MVHLASIPLLLWPIFCFYFPRISSEEYVPSVYGTSSGQAWQPSWSALVTLKPEVVDNGSEKRMMIGIDWSPYLLYKKQMTNRALLSPKRVATIYRLTSEENSAQPPLNKDYIVSDENVLPSLKSYLVDSSTKRSRNLPLLYRLVIGGPAFVPPLIGDRKLRELFNSMVTIPGKRYVIPEKVLTGEDILQPTIVIDSNQADEKPILENPLPTVNQYISGPFRKRSLLRQLVGGMHFYDEQLQNSYGWDPDSGRDKRLWPLLHNAIHPVLIRPKIYRTHQYESLLHRMVGPYGKRSKYTDTKRPEL